MDVFQVVRALRVQKPGAVHTVVCLMQNHIATSCNSHHSLIHRSSTRQCMMLFFSFKRPLMFMLCLPRISLGIVCAFQ